MFDLTALAPDPGLTPRSRAARNAARLVRRRAGERRRSGRGSICQSAAIVEGPAVLEQPDATTVVDPGLIARVDEIGNLIIERATP